MAVYNLKKEYAPKLDQEFKTKSYTESFVGHGYTWNGSNAITIWSVGHGVLNDYDFTAAQGSRMGAVHEIDDEIHTYTLKNFKAFRETYEQLKNMDQENLRKKVSIMKDIVDMEYVPLVDKYRLKTWAEGAGQALLSTAAIDKSNIVATLLSANAMLDNKFVPQDGRVAFMKITDAIQVQLADELKYDPKYIEKGAVNGEITRLGKTRIVGIPDYLMPAGVKILFKWSGSTVDPEKLHWMKEYEHVEGFSGPVMNGLFRYDSFVLAKKANGILVVGDTTTASSNVAAPTATISSGVVTLASTSTTAAGNFYFTVDGRNPKTVGSEATNAKVTDTLTAGTIVNAYVNVSGKLPSAISSFKVVDASTIETL